MIADSSLCDSFSAMYEAQSLPMCGPTVDKQPDRSLDRGFVALLPVMAYVTGPDDEIQSVSSVWLRRLGYSREEVIAQPASRFLVCRRPRTTQELAADMCEDVPACLLGKAGDLRHVRVSARREFDDRGQLLRGWSFFADARETHEALRRARETSSRSEALTAALPDLVVEVDSLGRFLRFKPAGAAGDAATGEAMADRCIEHTLPPKLAAKAKRALAASMRTKQICRFACELPTPTGARLYECSICPTLHQTAMMVVRDVTVVCGVRPSY